MSIYNYDKELEQIQEKRKEWSEESQAAREKEIKRLEKEYDKKLKREEYLKKEKDRTGLWIGLLALAIFLLFFGMGAYTVIHREINYNNSLENPPEFRWFEEDLEKVFYTTDIYVSKRVQDKEHIYLKVRVENTWYNVHYRISLVEDGNWIFDGYIGTKENG